MCKMTKELSEKIRFLSFISIVFVLYIHSYYTEGEKYASFVFLVNILGNGLSFIAVPLFYLISGYLFFLGTKDNGIKKIIQKQKRRIRSLLIPYIIANSICLLFTLFVQYLSVNFSSIHSLIVHSPLKDAGPGIVDILFYSFVRGPIAFQLWFLRDLMVFVLFSPILYLILKLVSKSRYTLYIGLTILLTVVFIRPTAFTWALGWFCLGGLCALSSFISITNCEKYKHIGILSIIFMFICIVVNALSSINLLHTNIHFSNIVFSGIIGVWILYDCYRLTPPKYLHNCFNYTFFIFLFHEPFLNIFKKIPLLLSTSALMIDICYILVPIIFLFIAVLIAKFIQVKLPRCYKIIVGGR